MRLGHLPAALLVLLLTAVAVGSSAAPVPSVADVLDEAVEQAQLAAVEASETRQLVVLDGTLVPPDASERPPRVRLPEPALPTLPAPVAAAPAAEARPAALALRIPVLMYHYISAVPANEAASRFAVDLRVPPEVFEQHLAHLRSQGYQTVSTPQLWEALKGRAKLPAKPVVLSFDDGYADAYTNALPLLQKHGYIGTFFITVNLVGKPGYLSWDQVRGLAAAGMDIQSHAMDHKPMTAFTLAGLGYQMGAARDALQRQIGREVRFFAYPSGEYNGTAMQGAAANGYYGAFRKSGGVLQSLDWQFALRRQRVPGYASVETLRKALAN